MTRADRPRLTTEPRTSRRQYCLPRRHQYQAPVLENRKMVEEYVELKWLTRKSSR